MGDPQGAPLGLFGATSPILGPLGQLTAALFSQPGGRQAPSTALKTHNGRCIGFSRSRNPEFGLRGRWRRNREPAAPLPSSTPPGLGRGSSRSSQVPGRDVLPKPLRARGPQSCPQGRPGEAGPRGAAAGEPSRRGPGRARGGARRLRSRQRRSGDGRRRWGARVRSEDKGPAAGARASAPAPGRAAPAPLVLARAPRSGAARRQRKTPPGTPASAGSRGSRRREELGG